MIRTLFSVGLAGIMIFLSIRSTQQEIPMFLVYAIGGLSLILLISQYGKRGSVWFMIATWNAITLWVGSLLYTQWNDTFMMIFQKILVYTLLALTVVCVFFYKRATMEETTRKKHKKESGFSWIVQLFQRRKKQQELVYFPLGTNVDDHYEEQ